jgi:hypothetical protein
MFERLGCSAQSWQARLQKLKGDRLLGRFVATAREAARNGQKDTHSVRPQIPGNRSLLNNFEKSREPVLEEKAPQAAELVLRRQHAAEEVEGNHESPERRRRCLFSRNHGDAVTGVVCGHYFGLSIAIKVP